MPYEEAGFDIQGTSREHVNRKTKKWQGGKRESPKEAVPNTAKLSGVGAQRIVVQYRQSHIGLG